MEKDVAQKNNRINGSESYAKVVVCMIAGLYALLSLFCFLKPQTEYSFSERRKLAQMPDFTWEAIKTGKYAQQTEEYVVDQFPMRDEFRSLKSHFSLGVMQKQDTNGIYVEDGYLCKAEYPMDENSIKRAAEIFEKIYIKYLQNTDVQTYITVVPDKNYFLADSSMLAMDYAAFFDLVYESTPFLYPIAIEDTLDLTDYYKTDTHWKQEAIIDTAKTLAEGMNVPFAGEFTFKRAEGPFYGVYYGQAGLSLPADEITYCTNIMLESCVVYDYENNRAIPLYDLSKTEGKDPYEMFLGGNVSLVTIENPQSLSKRELVVFGDSFSRSLLPLLAESYQKITMVDIRYLPSEYIGNYMKFDNQDVLFLYSTSVLNNSITLK